MIVKIRMSADEIRVFDTNNFTRTLISPKEIDQVYDYKDTVLVRIAEGLPTEKSKTYRHKNWKKITVVDDKNTHIIYTPNETYVINDKGKVVDYL